MPHFREIKSERRNGEGGKEGGKEGGNRWDANEKAGPESGMEKINNGKTEEMEYLP